MAMVSHSREIAGVGRCVGMGFNEGKHSKKAFYEGANNAQRVGAREPSIPPLHTRFPWLLGKSAEVLHEL